MRAGREVSLHWLMAAAGVVSAVVLFAFSARVFLNLGLTWHCPVMTVLDLPCPSCGSTRALAALSVFDFGSAFRYNPLFAIAAPVAVLGYAFRNYIHPLRHLGWPLFFGVVFLNWWYLFFFLPR